MVRNIACSISQLGLIGQRAFILMAAQEKSPACHCCQFNKQIMGTPWVALPPRYAEESNEDDAEDRKECFKACFGRLINNIAVSQ